jgi:beta-hydroxyacyl-ACP dehydratase FabZ
MSEPRMPLGIQEIMKLIPHRFPMLLVDQVIEFTPKTSIIGLKNVTINEPYFTGHFPGHPIMPGVLIIESMAQVGALFVVLSNPDLLSPLLYFRKIDRAKFKKPVFPGHSLRHKLTLLYHRGPLWRFRADSTVEGDSVVTAELEAVVIENRKAPAGDS